MTSESGRPTLQELRLSARRELLESLPELSEDIAQLEADILLAAVLGTDRGQLFLRRTERLAAAAAETFGAMLDRRRAREPIAYIIGRKEFYSRDFLVNPAVLVPRPETELLVDRALHHLTASGTIVDVGVGSGAIVLSVLAELRSLHGEAFLESVEAFGIDISREALEVAASNARLFGLEDKLQLLCGDLLAPLASRRFPAGRAIVVANLPYIPDGEALPDDVARYEPHSALYAGSDGLDAIKRLITQVASLFEGTEQLLAIEIGSGQHLEVECLARAQGYSEVSFFKDIQGITRVVELRRPIGRQKRR